MSSETKQRIHLYLSGRVQGVGFRAFTQRTAKQLGISGWVKNLADGRVEAVLAGEQELVDKMLTQVKAGPRFAEVDNVEVIDENYQGQFNSFEIRY